MKFYAGIGSRETPEELLKMMTAIATCLEKKYSSLGMGMQVIKNENISGMLLRMVYTFRV